MRRRPATSPNRIFHAALAGALCAVGCAETETERPDGDEVRSAFLYEGEAGTVLASSYDGTRVHAIERVRRDGAEKLDVVSHGRSGPPRTLASVDVSGGTAQILSVPGATFWALGTPTVVSVASGIDAPREVATLEGDVVLVVVGGGGGGVLLTLDGALRGLELDGRVTTQPYEGMRVPVVAASDGTVFATTDGGIVQLPRTHGDVQLAIPEVRPDLLVADEDGLLWVEQGDGAPTLRRARPFDGAVEALVSPIAEGSIDHLWIHDDFVYARVSDASSPSGRLLRLPRGGDAWESVDLELPFETWEVDVRPGTPFFAVGGTLAGGGDVLLVLEH